MEVVNLRPVTEDEAEILFEPAGVVNTGEVVDACPTARQGDRV